MKRNLLIGGSFVALLVALTVAQSAVQRVAAAQAQNGVMAPRFEVDPTFPKPLPNGWYQGQTIGLWVDAQDHVWIVHRPDVLDAAEGASSQTPPTGECCNIAPPVLEFDQQGNLLRHWGGKDGPGYQWPASNHGITVDKKGNVWVGGNGAGNDGHVVKFTKDGKFLAQYGVKKQGLTADSNSWDRFYEVAKIFDDPKTNELYLADGYGNRRVAVIDGDSGKILRFWGAYGNKPDDGPLPAYNPAGPLSQQFRGPVHCAVISIDRVFYVGERRHNRAPAF